MASIRLGGALAAMALSAILASPASAVTMKECSAKYQAAKKDGTLAGATWKSFRTTQCTSVTPTAATPTTSATTATAPAPGPAARTAAAPASGPASFPNAVDPKYSKESPGKARMHTCLDQYKANKAAGGNGGLRWIQKGGGYYSECSKKLKG